MRTGIAKLTFFVSSSAPPSSPCIDICELAGDVCRGCGRSLDEITVWGSMSEPERRKVMGALPARLRAMGDKAAAPDAAITHIKAILNEAD